MPALAQKQTRKKSKRAAGAMHFNVHSKTIFDFALAKLNDNEILNVILRHTI
jgi:hypothetical protein